MGLEISREEESVTMATLRRPFNCFRELKRYVQKDVEAELTHICSFKVL